MRKLRWQLLIAVGGLVLVFGYLLGQSPSQENTPPEAITGGIYREALIGMVNRLNPILEFNNQVDRDINRLLYRSLVRFDSRGIAYPDLAQSWAISADATLYTFKLRDDALWHDGKPLQADDVLYTFSKFTDEDYPGPQDLQELWSDVKVVRLDDLTVQFQLSEPFAPFLDFVSVGLLPEHLLRGVSAGELIDHPFNTQPIGTGPFRFSQFLFEDDEIVGVSLLAFDDFYEGRVYLDQIDFLFYPDEGRAFQAYLDDEVIGISRVSETILDRVLEVPDLNVHSARQPINYMVYLNLENPEKTFFTDKSFRQALILSINRQWIIDSLFSGQAVITSSPIFSSTWAYLDSIEPWPFDPQKAESLLNTLGWEVPEGAMPNSTEYVRNMDDVPLSFELIHASDTLHSELAEDLRESWERIGIHVELIPVPSDELIPNYLETRDFEAILVEMDLSKYTDPDPYPFWHDFQIENGQNYSGFSDRNIGIWLEKARTTSDLATRAELYKSFQYRFHDQEPALILFSPIYNYAIDAQIQGVSMGPIFDPSDRFNSIHEWHILSRRPSEPQVTETTSP